MTIQIPEPDDERVLRHVRFDGYRLLLWDAGHGVVAHRTYGGHTCLGYALFEPPEHPDNHVHNEAFHSVPEPLFVGEDFRCPGHVPTDSDDAIRSLLGFLTLRPGDTDDEYFESYTARQREFAEGPAEELAMWALDIEDGEERPPFEDIVTPETDVCGSCGEQFTRTTRVTYNEGRPEGPDCPKCTAKETDHG